MKDLAALSVAFAMMALAGCNGSNDVPDPVNPAYDALHTDFALSREMRVADRVLFRNDVVALSQVQFDEPGDSFEAIFDGNTSKDVMTYIQKRMKYFVASTTDVAEKLEQAGAIRDEKLAGDAGTSQNQGVLMARNLGVVLWINYLIDRPHQLRYRFDDTAIVPNDPRVGIVQLGPGYRSDLPQAARIATIVHEARHSDCTGGLARDDLTAIQNNQTPATKSCGHLHVICPAGHDLAGLPACDDEAWGAYSVDYIYSRAVARSCANCTENDRQSAMALASDSASRILVFDDMVAGNLGLPDMSSKPEIEN